MTGGTPVERVLDALEVHGCRPKRAGAGYQARCPAHEDRTPSLSLTEGADQRALLHCHAGCTLDAILHALDLEPSALYVDQPRRVTSKREVARYPYTDEHGQLLYTVIRYDTPTGKTFSQQAADGNWTVRGIRRVPWQYPDLLAGLERGDTIFIAEGEKDAQAIRHAGAVATTNAGGADQWPADWAPIFTGADIVIVADRDQAGYKRARTIHAQLEAHAAQVRTVAPVEGKDAFDHLAAGYGLDQLELCDPDLELEAEQQPPDPPPLADSDAPDQPRGTIRTDTGDRYRDGGPFILDQPTEIPCRWGEHDRVLWARGESLLIVGPAGVGKTTLLAQIVGATIGLLPPALLGLPISTTQRVLYLACDRPQQIARAHRRLYDEADRAELNEHLTFWAGPPVADFSKDTSLLADMAAAAKADVVVLDSLKDVAIGLSEDAVAAGLNSAIQLALAYGIDVVATHHQRKQSPGAGPPKHLADVFGSAWITAGAGSVILLWGEPGDAVVTLTHLKQPAEVVGPWSICHDQHTGRTSLDIAEVDPYVVLQNQGTAGLTARELATIIREGGDPTKNQVKRAARRLEGLERRGAAISIPGTAGGADGGTATRWHLRAHDQDTL